MIRKDDQHYLIHQLYYSLIYLICCSCDQISSNTIFSASKRAFSCATIFCAIFSLFRASLSARRFAIASAINAASASSSAFFLA